MNHIPQIYRRLGNSISLDLGGLDDIRQAVKPIPEIDTAVTALQPQLSALSAAVAANANAIALVNPHVDTVKASLDRQLGAIDRALTPIHEIDRAVAALPTQINAVAAAVAANGNAIAQTGPRFDALSNQLCALQKAVDRLGAHPGPITDDGAAAIRLLIQAQALALDQTPDEMYVVENKSHAQYKGWLKDNVALDRLRAAAKAAAAALPADSLLPGRIEDAFRDFRSGERLYRSQRFWEMHVLIQDIAAL